MPGLIAGALALGATLYLAAAALVVALGLREDPGPADVAVVLGSQVEADGTPTWRLAVRLERALAAWRDGLVPVVLVSGGRDRTGWEETPVMKAWLVAHGVPDSCVVEDPQGRNTWRTARNTRAWLAAHGARRVLVVSQYFHLPRCRLAFARFGVRDVRSACPHRFEWRDLTATAREVPALLKYALRWDR